MRSLLVFPVMLASCGAAPRPRVATAPIAPPVAPPPAPAPPPARVATVRAAHDIPCARSEHGTNNICDFTTGVALGDGRFVFGGSVHGEASVGGRAIHSVGFENALLVGVAADGSVEWARTYGTHWHNEIRRMVRLADGRVAVAAIVANGFHPSLATRPTPANRTWESERDVVGVVDTRGEFAWVHDWPARVEDLRATDDGLEVVDDAGWTRVNDDGAVVATRPLPPLPEGSPRLYDDLRLGRAGCVWRVFVADPRGAARTTARHWCGDAVTDTPLADLRGSPGLLFQTSPDGESLYVVADLGRTVGAGAARRFTSDQRLVRVDAAGGLRYATHPWPASESPEWDHLVRAEALAVGDDAVDVLETRSYPITVAGVALPAARSTNQAGTPRESAIARIAPRDGSLVALFEPPTGPGQCLGQYLTTGSSGERQLFARVGPATWLRGSYVPAPTCALPSGGVATVLAGDAAP